MKSSFKTGSYSLVWGDGSCSFVRIDGDRMKFFDSPVDPLLGTLVVSEREEDMPNRDDVTEHLIDGDLLLLKTPAGDVKPIRMALEPA